MVNREIIEHRFVPNKIVIFLLEMTKEVDLNKLWSLTNKGVFSVDELKEFYQLIGYSEGGYCDLFPEEVYEE